jgi:hypothetical protein
LISQIIPRRHVEDVVGLAHLRADVTDLGDALHVHLAVGDEWINLLIYAETNL